MGPTYSHALAVDSKINRALDTMNKMETNVHKLLLLGTGESGKTTIFKQMILTKGNGFDPEYRASFRTQIMGNIIQGTTSLLEGMEDFGIKITDAGLLAAIDTVKQTIKKKETKLNNKSNSILNMSWNSTPRPHHVPTEIDEDLKNAILDLWKSDQIQEVYERCLKYGQYNLPETYKAFVSKLRDVPGWGGAAWIPDDRDVLLVRQRTTGMADVSFHVGKLNFRLIDVGGQRSERKKWLFLFDNVTAVIFVASLSEYDQTLWENSSINRFQETMHLFKHHAELNYFKNAAFILFLNKLDLFEDKYMKQKIPLNYSGLFPEAPLIEDEAPGSCDNGLAWYRDKLLSTISSKKRDVVYVHFTNALDSTQMQTTIDLCGEHIVEASLKLSKVL